MNQQEKYKQEFEKYKDVVLVKGTYRLKSKPSILIKIISIDKTDDCVLTEKIDTNQVRVRTMHWCRKNLEWLS